MRKPLNQRIPRELKTNAGRYIGIFLILVCTILVGSSFMATAESVEYTLEKTEKENQIENGYFETATEVTDSIYDYFTQEDVILTDNFYTTINDFDKDAKLFVFNERTVLDKPSVFEGELPKKKDEIALDRLFAKNRGIEIGDAIELNEESFTVTGIISLPDYTSLFMNNQDLVMNTNDFGVSVVSKEGFERFPQNSITYRYSYRFKEQNLSEKDKMDAAADIQKEVLKEGILLQNLYTEETNQSISFLKEDMGTDVPMMKVFVYILIAVIAFVFAVLTDNTIEEEANIIGTLRASGYYKREILAHYMMPTIFIAIIGSVVGNALGYSVMLKPFEDIYYTTYCVPPIELQFSLDGFITTTVLPVIIMILINSIMLFNKLSLSPLKFLRRDLNKRKQKKAVKLPDFSFMNRFRLRVILQNKVSYLILFFGIFLSSFLLMFGIGLEPLMTHYVDEIDDTLPYEYQYILKAPVETEDGEKMEVYSMDTWYELGKTDIGISFMGIESDTEFFGNVLLPKKENEIVISEPMSKKLNLEEGDSMLIKDSKTDKEYTLKISGISDYKGSVAAFMKLENLNKLLDKDNDYYNAYISNEKLDIDDMYIAKYITRKDMTGAAKQMVQSFESVIVFIKLFSIGIYMILMYILTKTVIDKNAVSISFMKVFGYNSREINKLYLNATTIIVMASLFICIPVEIIGFRYVMVFVSSMVEGYIEFYLPLWVYGVIIAVGIAAYCVINSIHVWKVKKISMGEALKNRE